MKILVLDNYDSFVYNLVHLLHEIEAGTVDVIKNDKIVGKVTSAVYSPRLQKNIALAMIDISETDINNSIQVKINEQIINAIVVPKPFYDPNKKITSTKL